LYEEHYQFHRQPFSSTPDPEFLYKSDSHTHALEQLERGVRRREGMVLLTGDVGTGKTTTTRALLQQLDPNVFSTLVLNPFVTAEELLRVLLQNFEVVSDSRALRDAGRQDLVETLNRFLLSLAAVGASALAVVDEAQNLEPPVLEQLRVLTTLETDQYKLLQILLVGQPELETVLRTPDMSPLNQRVARRCLLRPLSREEVEEYVRFRVRLARGAWKMLFTTDALEQVHQLSEGIPRRINLLCDRSLEAGYISLSPQVTDSHVRDAAEALKWIPPRDQSVAGDAVSSGSAWWGGTRRWVAAAVMVGVLAGLLATVAVLTYVVLDSFWGVPPSS